MVYLWLLSGCTSRAGSMAPWLITWFISTRRRWAAWQTGLFDHDPRKTHWNRWTIDAHTIEWWGFFALTTRHVLCPTSFFLRYFRCTLTMVSVLTKMLHLPTRRSSPDWCCASLKNWHPSTGYVPNCDDTLELRNKSISFGGGTSNFWGTTT